MKNEHFALLAALNDNDQCRRGDSCLKLRELPSDRLRSLLEDYTEKKRSGEMLASVNPALELIMRRGPSADILSNYLRIIQTYLDNNVRIMTYWDEDYPKILRSIPNPPLILYVRGKTFPAHEGLAIVGTRKASERGLELSRMFAKVMTEEGHTIVSGLASGIDTAAHKGSLEGNGSTIAVLAGDIDRIYPDENSELAHRICENGAIVSEITPKVEMSRSRFVERNRITSGLSEAVLIIETGTVGGTVRQAEYARSQKRRLFVVDHGRFDRTESEKGFEHLVGLGATPVRHPGELSGLLDR